MAVDAAEEPKRAQRDVAEIGRQLAAAAGFRAVARDGADLGRVEHVRYGRRVDRPDEVVIRKTRFLPWRTSVVAFDRVEAVDARRRMVVIRHQSE